MKRNLEEDIINDPFPAKLARIGKALFGNIQAGLSNISSWVFTGSTTGQPVVNEQTTFDGQSSLINESEKDISRPVVEKQPSFSNDGLLPTTVSNKAIQQSTMEEIEQKYYNDLRHSAANNDILTIRKIREKISIPQYLHLLKKRNDYSTGCIIIQYATKYNNADAIHELMKGLTVAQQVAIFKTPYYLTQCNALHFTVNEGNLDAARAIKEYVFFKDDHSYWVELLSAKQYNDETPVHYAARWPLVPFLESFSNGLSVEEWFSIVSMQYKSNPYNALVIYFINMNNKSIDVHYKNISAIQGPLSSKLWLQLLLSHCGNCRTIDYLFWDFNEIKYKIFEYICAGLDSEDVSLLEETLSNAPSYGYVRYLEKMPTLLLSDPMKRQNKSSNLTRDKRVQLHKRSKKMS